MRFEFKIDYDALPEEQLFVAIFYSKSGEEHARDEAMGTDNPGIYHFAAQMPGSIEDFIKMIQAGTNEMLSLHELKLNGEHHDITIPNNLSS